MRSLRTVPKKLGTVSQTAKFFAMRLFSTILLLLALSSGSPAQDQGDTRVERCSNVAAAGEWGLTTTGTVFLPTGAVQVAIVGRFTLDADGNLSGTQTRSLNGTISRETFTGTINVNPDCTGTATIDVFHSGVLNRTATLDLVFLDNLRGFRAVFTSAIAQPSGTTISTVLLMDGKRVFRREE